MLPRPPRTCLAPRLIAPPDLGPAELPVPRPYPNTHTGLAVMLGDRCRALQTSRIPVHRTHPTLLPDPHPDSLLSSSVGTSGTRSFSALSLMPIVSILLYWMGGMELYKGERGV